MSPHDPELAQRTLLEMLAPEDCADELKRLDTTISRSLLAMLEEFRRIEAKMDQNAARLAVIGVRLADIESRLDVVCGREYKEERPERQLGEVPL